MKNPKWFLLLLTTWVLGCDYTAYHEVMGGSQGAGQGGFAGSPIVCNPGDVTPAPAELMTYERLKAEVLSPKCIGCHSSAFAAAGVNLDDYMITKANASRIRFTVENNLMPKSPMSPLSAEEKNKVYAWIDDGLLETGAPPAECLPPGGNPEELPPAPPNSNGPLTSVPPDNEIRFTLIKDRIFALHCLSCHSGSSNSTGLFLDNHAEVTHEIEDIQEEVFKGAMPPPPRPQLSRIERDVLQRWIDIGMPQ